MLTKIIGTGTVLTLSAVAQTFTATTQLIDERFGIPNQNIPPFKVRVASTQPAYIAFGTVANSSTSVLLPPNVIEHFKLDNTSTISVLQAGAGGLISIHPVA